MKARWPDMGVVDQTLIREAEYFNEVVHEFRLRIKKMMDMRGKVCGLHGFGSNAARPVYGGHRNLGGGGGVARPQPFACTDVPIVVGVGSTSF